MYLLAGQALTDDNISEMYNVNTDVIFYVILLYDSTSIFSEL